MPDAGRKRASRMSEGTRAGSHRAISLALIGEGRPGCRRDHSDRESARASPPGGRENGQARDAAQNPRAGLGHGRATWIKNGSLCGKHCQRGTHVVSLLDLVRPGQLSPAHRRQNRISACIARSRCRKRRLAVRCLHCLEDEPVFRGGGQADRPGVEFNVGEAGHRDHGLTVRERGENCRGSRCCCPSKGSPGGRNCDWCRCRGSPGCEHAINRDRIWPRRKLLHVMPGRLQRQRSGITCSGGATVSAGRYGLPTTSPPAREAVRSSHRRQTRTIIVRMRQRRSHQSGSPSTIFE